MLSKEFYIVAAIAAIITCAAMLFIYNRSNESPGERYKREYLDQGKGWRHHPTKLGASAAGQGTAR